MFLWAGDHVLRDKGVRFAVRVGTIGLGVGTKKKGETL